MPPSPLLQPLTEQVLAPVLLAMAQAHMYQCRPVTAALWHRAGGAWATAADTGLRLTPLPGVSTALTKVTCGEAVRQAAQIAVDAIAKAHPDVVAAILPHFAPLLPNAPRVV